MPSSLSFNHPPNHHHHHHCGADHVCPWNREGANVFSQTPPFAVGRCHPIPSSPAHRYGDENDHAKEEEDEDGNKEEEEDDGDVDDEEQEDNNDDDDANMMKLSVKEIFV